MQSLVIKTSGIIWKKQRIKTNSKEIDTDWSQLTNFFGAIKIKIIKIIEELKRITK